MTEHKTIEYKSNSIHYFVSGDPHDEAIVFLHPAFGDHRCFDHQTEPFSRHHRVIAIDMPGHGSTGAGNSKVKIAETATLVAKILRVEGHGQTHLVGVSLGSLIAQDFALKHPDKTLSLTALGGYNINHRQPEVLKAQAREMLGGLARVIFSMESFRRYAALVSAIVESEQERFYESAKRFTRRSFTVMSGLGGLIADRAVSRDWPLLILTGEKDSELALKMAARWHEEEPGSEHHIIAGAGHCANMDNAAEFNRIVMEFLRTSSQRNIENCTLP